MSWINTVTGKRVDLLDPKPDQIDIVDIAYVLGGEWRFSGHSRPKLSVARHSIAVSYYCDPLAGLMHDASEAYLRDIPKPLKNMLPGYHEIEDRFMKIIAKKFGFRYPFTDDVHVADQRAFSTEVKLFFPLGLYFSDSVVSPLIDTKHYEASMYPDDVRFLQRFKEITEHPAWK